MIGPPTPYSSWTRGQTRMMAPKVGASSPEAGVHRAPQPAEQLVFSGICSRA